MTESIKADILADIAQAAIEREDFWKDFNYQQASGWVVINSEEMLWEALRMDYPIRRKGPVVQVSGELSTSVIKMASIMVDRMEESSTTYMLAEAILGLVNNDSI